MTKTQKLMKAKASVTRVPQNRDEVVSAIAEIGTGQRERQRIETEMNDAIAALKEQFELRAEPHKIKIADLQKGVQIWCEANRELLTQGGKVKTAAFASGEVRWRMTPPAVTIRKAALVLAALTRLGMDRFIRTKKEVNKEAILLEPEAVKTVPGIIIDQAEEFIVVPFETKLDEVA